MSTRFQHRGRHYPRGDAEPSSSVFAWRSVGGVVSTANPNRWLFYKTPYSTAFVWKRPTAAGGGGGGGGNDDYIIRARRRGRR